ncbi:MAG: SMC family ATPase [Desulfurococcales archaeon]|nr:SMC family ATPase [Desulfurococcales archaeon]
MGQVILDKLRLTNFKSHEKTEISLGEGIIAIIGDNGAGKSSIIEAVYTVLAGRPPTGRYSDLVTQGRTMGAVSLETVLPGGPRYSMEVRIDARGRKGSGTYMLRELRNGSSRILATRQEAYVESVARILGLRNVPEPEVLVERAAVIRQGGLREIASLMERGGKRLREELEAALGIPDYAVATEALSSKNDKLIIETGTRLGPVWFTAVVQKRVDAARNKVLEELKSTKKGLEEKLGELENWRKREAEARRAIESLRKELEEVESGLRSIGSATQLRRRLDEKREELDHVIKSLREKEAELREAEEKASKLSMLESLDRLRGDIERLKSMKSELEILKGKIRELREVKEHVEAVKLLEPSLRERDRARELLEKAEERLRLAERELGKIEESLKSAEERAREAKSRIERLLEKASSIVGARISNLEEAQRVLEELHAETLSLEDEKSRLEARLGALRGLVESIDHRLKILEAPGREPKCPLCGAQLTAEKMEEIRRHLEDEKKRLEREFEEAESRLEHVVRMLEERRRIARSLEELVARIRDYERERVDAEAKMSEYLEKLRSARASRDEARRALDEVRGVYEKVSRDVARFEASRGWLVIRGYWPLDRAEKEVASLGSLEGKAEELGRLAAELERKIVKKSGFESLEEAERASREASQKLVEARVAAEKIGALRSEVDGLRDRLEKLRRDVEELESSLEEAEALEAKAVEMKNRLEEEREKLNRASSNAARIQGEIDGTRSQISRLKKELDGIERARRIVAAGIAANRILGRLKELLYERRLRLLEDEMSRILSMFNLDYVGVRFDRSGDGVSISVYNRTGAAFSVSQLSGGEKTVLALAYVLALSRVIGWTRIGFLILDEPTAELDEERRAMLLKVIRDMARSGGLGVRQLIIVSHHDEVVDLADTVCRVYKTPKGSKVECSEAGMAGMT